MANSNLTSELVFAYGMIGTFAWSSRLTTEFYAVRFKLLGDIIRAEGSIEADRYWNIVANGSPSAFTPKDFTQLLVEKDWKIKALRKQVEELEEQLENANNHEL